MSFKRLFCSRDCWANWFFFFAFPHFCLFQNCGFQYSGKQKWKIYFKFWKSKQNVLPYSHSVFIRTSNFWADDERSCFNLSPQVFLKLFSIPFGLYLYKHVQRLFPISNSVQLRTQMRCYCLVT